MNSKDKEEKRLGSWINQQKINYKKNHLSEERICSLESVDGWKWEDNRKKMWEENRVKVKMFIEFQGKNPSLCSKNISEKKLSEWVRKQKNDRKRSRISKDRIISLESISGWKW